MFKIIAGVIIAVVLVVLGIAESRPATFRVQRSTIIKAPPEKIYASINDFHRWGEWSPYEKLDPNMQRTLSGADSGKGAVYAWAGNSQAGAGRMEIIESAPAAKVAIQLDFSQPMSARNTAEFTLVPQGASTTVTWAMYGPMPFVSKLFSVFCNMDQMIGKDFETGLANLKTLNEK